MNESELEKLRFPVGNFSFPETVGESELRKWIAEIEQLPLHLSTAVKGLNDNQLNTTYRDGGWTLRQVVHHVADSHINAYTRIKLALTENNPTIKTYEEDAWAKLDDSINLPVEISLSLLNSLHLRWVYLLKKLSAKELEKTVFHPESKREMSIKFLISLYAWHSRHHTAHITSLRRRMNW